MDSTLTPKFDTFLGLADEQVESRPWLVVMLMHEYHRHLYPHDPYIPFEAGVSPVARIERVLDRCIETLRAGSAIGSYFDGDPVRMGEVCGSLAPAFADRTQEQPTQRVYGRLWDKFEPDEAPREAHRLLEDRLRGSSFDLASLAGKSALDCGCGCGRYTIALALSGAAPVFGTDLGAASIETAREMAQRANVSDIDFHVADALDLPFEDAKFDFVLSNGVLHHTTDMTHGLREMWRVMKPDGRAFLYVSATGGLFWYSRQRIPAVMSRIPQEYCMAVLELLGMPGNRFIFNDNWHVPIESHTPREELERAFTTAGFERFEKVHGTRATDLDVAVAGGDEAASALWGEGEHRYLLTKT